MFPNFPHRNLLASAIFAVAIFLIGVWVTRDGYPLSQNKTNSPATASVSNLETKDRDSDADGLPDWQEALYGSDIQKTDTDGDGVLDGDEVRTGHDPTKRGPNDLLYTPPTIATSSSDALGLQQEFYAQFLKQQGDVLRAATVKELMRNFKPQEFAPRFGLADLHVVSGNDPAALRTYGNEFGKLIIKYTQQKRPNETTILSAALASKDPKKIAELELPAIDYRNFSADLRKIPVPIDIAKDHLAIVNGYDIISRSLLALTHLFTDPLRADGAYQMYIKQIYSITAGYAAIGNNFNKNSIVFAKEDYGYFWNMKDTATSTGKTATTSKSASTVK